jgi:hypothetical protein
MPGVVPETLGCGKCPRLIVTLPKFLVEVIIAPKFPGLADTGIFNTLITCT